MMATLEMAAASMSGVLHGEDKDFRGISTDTRSLQKGELFFALHGPNFDGHDYVAKANDRGASAAVVTHRLDDEIAQIEVADTRLALGDLARSWRATKAARVVGITGSNGKTTLKELTAACLQTAGPTFATAGNFNNDIGVPLMLAQMDDEHLFAVIEMGANHAGEIAYLAELAAPDIVVISNAGAAHLEGFGSLDGVAKAKGEILQTCQRPRTAVLNADDKYFSYWTDLVADIELVSFGLSADADFHASDIQLQPANSRFLLHTPGSTIPVSLALPGIHNVRNACAAAAIAASLGVELHDIASAFATIKAVAGRLQPLTGIRDCTVFDDSYNANPLSVAAAAEFVADLDGQSWLVLGDMKELGEDAISLHREVGVSARASGVDRLFALGDLARHSADGFGAGGECYSSIESLLQDLLHNNGIDANTNVLVKGSRSMRMERVVEALQPAAALSKEA